MEWIIIVILLGLVIYFASRPPKIIEKEIKVDLTNEEKLKLEKYRLEQEAIIHSKLAEKEAHIRQIIEQKQEESYQKIKENEKKLFEEQEKLKQKLFNDLQNQLKLREELHDQQIKEEDLRFADFLSDQERIKQEYLQDIEKFKNEVEIWRQKHTSVIESYKQTEKLKEADNFHKLNLSEEEMEELEELNKAIKKLKNPMPFRKAIYDIYYKQKVIDLAIRVVGRERVSGIYKITNINSGKCYVGQSVDIGERWKQHCKRGCGAEMLTQNKLYPEMLLHGIHNFTFEVLETTTDTTKLNEMEKYWQNFYQAQEFGYSIR